MANPLNILLAVLLPHDRGYEPTVRTPAAPVRRSGAPVHLDAGTSNRPSIMERLTIRAQADRQSTIFNR